jgi:two-component system, LytTR family, response regulator
MIKTVLIDDEIDGIKVLQRLLETYCPDIIIVGKADGVDTGLKLIQQTGPDLVFLDIEMTHGNAFDLLNQLKSIDFQLIFVTAFDSYAVRAFKYGAVDYLVKPVKIDDLIAAVERVRRKMGGNDVRIQMKELMAGVEAIQLSQQKMAIPTLTGLIFVAVKDILRFEARGSYTAIHLSNKQEILATKYIKEYENVLPAALFCRVHKSHIINIHKIKEYQKGKGGYIVMEDGTSIEVASRRREEFLQRLLK